jgi:hypothetical protein|tara:strand:- start:1456 stop:2139 length:684 start_codon:yes stop_codon:yes gene_type:complete
MQLNYKCDYCKKEFAKEKTLFVHVCEPKRRHLAKNEKHVQYGLLTFRRFFEFNNPTAKAKTFEDFVGSPYYNAFVKFGSFMVNTNPIYPERFLDFVVKSGVKLDHWCRDAMYDTYVEELLKIEPADGAIQRSIQTMMDWADTNDAEWNHYFSYCNMNRATHDIKEGKISPWILLNCKAAKNMMQSMTDEQLSIIGPVLNPQFWVARFKRLPADVELVREVIKEGNIS